MRAAADVPESDLAETHARARAGDAGAMDEAVRAFSRWVAAKARREYPGVDRDDAESFAWEAVWRGVERCPSPWAVPSFAAGTFRYLMKNHYRSLRTRLSPGQGWHGEIPAPACDPSDVAAAREAVGRLLAGRPDYGRDVVPASPCVKCGDVWGYALPRCNQPARTGGRCNRCHTAKARGAPRRGNVPAHATLDTEGTMTAGTKSRRPARAAGRSGHGAGAGAPNPAPGALPGAGGGSTPPPRRSLPRRGGGPTEARQEHPG